MEKQRWEESEKGREEARITHTLSHTIFHTQLCHIPLCHTPSFTHNFVTRHFSHTTLSHTTLSHTTLSHTIFHTLAQNCHCEFCCGMHLTCKNNPIKRDRNGSVKRPDRVARSYHRHSPCSMKIGSWPCPINQAKSFPPWQIAKTAQPSRWHQMEVQMFELGLKNRWKNDAPVLGLAGCHWRQIGKLQVRFHPHAVWSSLARTDRHGFLAPCCEIQIQKEKHPSENRKDDS